MDTGARHTASARGKAFDAESADTAAQNTRILPRRGDLKACALATLPTGVCRHEIAKQRRERRDPS